MMKLFQKLIRLFFLLALFLSSNLSWSKSTRKSQQFIGILETGRMAIGGETTGIVLKTKQKTFELLLSPADKVIAHKLNGKSVSVTGEFHTRKGVERPDRKVLKVSKLKQQN